ncbi:hypothetical protein KSZ12_05100 [Parabacteroides distasonis]|uniref:hypothetical protein n=1 Tax=Parabacteroides distasonis TaxID=823 RepID=UPI001C38EDA8|nr:hypothetical protein [Parabacteroides distasonis]MBV4225229.1 hypothetical protein [Parabacteroides distasonis]
MKVLIPLEKSWIYDNPFVGTLIDEFSKYEDVEIQTGVAKFWAYSDKFDIIHIYWPQCLLQDEYQDKSLDDLRNQINEYKYNGTKIISTCLNLAAHYSANSKLNESYDLVYGMSDMIIHLAEYSKSLLTQKFPNVRSIIIEHHVYDTLYKEYPTKKESLNKLNLDEANHYILSFGTYRSREERNFVIKVAMKVYKRTKYKFLIPIFLRNYGNETYKEKIRDIYYKLRLFFHPYIIYGNEYVDELLPYYYTATNISFIQRIKILNSGNVSMGFFWGHVVVGTEEACVGDILKKMGNPTFDYRHIESVVSAVEEAIKLVKSEKGSDNKKYVIENCIVSQTVRKIYGIYVK